MPPAPRRCGHRLPATPRVDSTAARRRHAAMGAAPDSTPAIRRPCAPGLRRWPAPRQSLAPLAEEAEALLDLRQGHADAARETLKRLAPGRDRAGRRARPRQRPAGTARRHERAKERRRAAHVAAGARAAAAAALGGCSLFDFWFCDHENAAAPGTRVAVLRPRARSGGRRQRRQPVTLPPPAAQRGLAAGRRHPRARDGHLPAERRPRQGLDRRYRRRRRLSAKITAQPVVAGGIVFTMDSDAVVSAFDLGRGGRLWRAGHPGRRRRQHQRRRRPRARRGHAVTRRPAGPNCWRSTPPPARSAGASSCRPPARSAPTIADGRLFVPTLDDQLLALALADGQRLWSYQAAAADTACSACRRRPIADGLVVAGFGSRRPGRRCAPHRHGGLDRQPRLRPAGAPACSIFARSAACR